MSTDIVLCCLDCRVKVLIAQDGLSGLTVYSDEPEAMMALGALRSEHQGHQLRAGDDQDYADGYQTIAWSMAKRKKQHAIKASDL